MEPMLLLCGKVKALPFFQLQDLSSEPQINPSPENQTEFLPRMGLLLRRRFSFSKSQEDGFQPPIRRTRDQELEFLDLLLLNRHPVRLPVDDLLFRSSPEEIRDILVQGLQDLKETVKGDGRQVPFDLGDKPLGQVRPLGQFLLGQVAQLSQIPDAFPDFHKAKSTVYEEISLVMCRTV